MTYTATQHHSATQATRSRKSKYEQALNVWPIHTEEDYDRAVAAMNILAVQPEGSLDPLDQARLDVFTELVAAYDAKHYALQTENVPPLELLQFLMEENGMNESDLGRLLGNRQTGHEILCGRRELSKRHIRILSERFKLSPAAFL